MAFGGQSYYIDPELSKIDGSIHYSVVGTYHAMFEDFSGTFHYDPNDVGKSWVVFEIKTASIKSRFETLDNIVRSKQIFDVENYPLTIFKSKSMTPGEQDGELLVVGDLILHGVTKEITFPFYVEGPFENKKDGDIRAKGKWVINRKEFNIIWSKWLDVGGILVGNHITVDWEIVGFRKKGGM